jgi:Ferritin-like
MNTVPHIDRGSGSSGVPTNQSIREGGASIEPTESRGRSATESKIVVAHREDLWWLLTEAAQLEHMLMCEYLFAEFSLKEGEDRGLTGEQAEAIARWRTLVRGIAVEEMLHLALVSNVMASIGAAPTFTRPNFPQRSRYFPSTVQLDLLPFGEQAPNALLVPRAARGDGGSGCGGIRSRRSAT